MQIKVNLDREEKMTNIGFVKALVEMNMFTTEDLQEICSYLYVMSYMFGSKNRGESKVLKEFVERLHTELRMYGQNDTFNKAKFLTLAENIAKEMSTK